MGGGKWALGVGAESGGWGWELGADPVIEFVIEFVRPWRQSSPRSRYLQKLNMIGCWFDWKKIQCVLWTEPTKKRAEPTKDARSRAHERKLSSNGN